MQDSTLHECFGHTRATGCASLATWVVLSYLGHPARPRLASRLSFPWRVSSRDNLPMTDTQWLRIRSFLDTCSGLRREGELGPRLPSATGASGHMQTDPDLSAVRLDSTVGRMHMSAAGAPKNKEAEPVLGRSRGSFSPQIHILTDRWGRPLRLRVTGGHATTAPSRALGKPGPTVLPDRRPGAGQRRLPRGAGVAEH